MGQTPTERLWTASEMHWLRCFAYVSGFCQKPLCFCWCQIGGSIREFDEVCIFERWINVWLRPIFSTNIAVLESATTNKKTAQQPRRRRTFWKPHQPESCKEQKKSKEERQQTSWIGQQTSWIGGRNQALCEYVGYFNRFYVHEES